MRRVLFALLLTALVAPFATADTPPVTTAPVAETAAPEAEAAPAVDLEVTLDELFADLDATTGAESKYICMEGCTNERDCELNQDPDYCPQGAVRMCNNPTGRACAGTCFCC